MKHTTTSTRLAKLEAVAEAAQTLIDGATGERERLNWLVLQNALDDVADFPTSSVPSVTVRAAVRICSDGLLIVHGQQTDGTVYAGTKRGDWIMHEGPDIIATITAEVPLPVVPTIAATVEPMS